MKRKTKGEITFEIVNYIIMALVVLVTLYPLWYVVIGSLSDPNAVIRGDVTIWIKDFTLASYKEALATEHLGSSYLNTIFYSVAGTAISLVMTILAAYVLSKKRLVGRKFLTLMLMFTMWFGAGMMPTYVTYQSYGLIDTRFAVLMHGACATYYVVLMKSYFEAIPQEMEESAKIDGASDIRTMLSIYLPLSVAALMTIGMYYFVGRWNAFFWEMILLVDNAKLPLQVILKKLIVDMQGVAKEGSNIDLTSTSTETMIYATMIMAIVPMLCVYPFIEKFFVKGVMIGAVKG